MARDERFDDLLEVVVAAEEGEVVAGRICVLAGHQVGDRRAGGGAVREARRDRVDDAHRELARVKRRVDVDPAGAVR